MNKNPLITAVGASLIALVACSEIPKEAYFARGNPESLLESRNHDMVFGVKSKQSVRDIMAWVAKAAPRQASLHCEAKNKACNTLERLLTDKGIEVERAYSAANDAIFSIERMAARKCENRYVDNIVNPYNLNHPTFGCTVSSNIAQMVTDKRQFTDPDLMVNPDARKSVQTTDYYNTGTKPDTEFKPIVTTESLNTGSGTGR